MKGRRPTPSAMKTRSGVQPSGPPPDCPDWLDDVAKTEWLRVMPELIRSCIISPVDAMTLASYCQTYSQWKQAEARVREEGSTVVDNKGNIKLHPLARHSLALLAELRRIGEQFGFTPIARQRIDAPPSGEEHDAFEDFAGGRSNAEVGQN